MTGFSVLSGLSGSTRENVRFSLNSQNHPSEIARRKRVSHHGHVRNMPQCEQDWAGSQAGCGRKVSSSKVQIPRKAQAKNLKGSIKLRNRRSSLSLLLLLLSSWNLSNGPALTTMIRDHEQFPADDNGDVLWHLRTKGDSLTKPRELDFTVIFPSEEAAIEFAVTCLRSEFKVEFREAEEKQDDGLNWEVIAYTYAVPTHSDITMLEDALGKQAAPLGGRTSGWSAVFVPSA